MGLLSAVKADELAQEIEDSVLEDEEHDVGFAGEVDICVGDKKRVMQGKHGEEAMPRILTNDIGSC